MEERRGWIKVHFAVDVETRQITAYEVTDEQHDNRVFRNLVEKSEERAKIRKVLADKAHYEIFYNLLFAYHLFTPYTILSFLSHPRQKRLSIIIFS